MAGGRVAKELISVLGTVAAVSTGAYLVTRPRPATAPDSNGRRIVELERRLAVLEQTGALAPTPPPPPPVATPASAPLGHMQKPYTVTHYENLASQVAHERQIAELERRLAAIEAARGAWTPTLNGAATRRERRHG